MCGVAGIFTFAHRSDRAGNAFAGGSTQEDLERMIKHLIHRGPDDRGASWIRGDSYELGLGHTRLSIIDLSAAGRQPMHDQRTGNCLVFNGEIYNYRDIRRAIKVTSEDWTSQTDTEVILKAYDKWGVDCVKHLRGMFAFALWDARKRRLFIARDRLGVKPLYYYRDEGKFIFASEVRAILASGLAPRQIDPFALNEYLAYQSIPAPRTLIKGIKALLPGTWMTIDETGAIQEYRYWDLLQDSSTEAKGADKATILSRTRELLRESTELHLISDVPLGVFLSGGIDSSAIVALISELGITPRTFSVVFAESNYDESVYARQVAARFAAEHTEIPLREATMLDRLPDALAAMDQPTGDGVNTYVVSQAVKDAGVPVALSGLGGDEFFVGYPSFLRLEKAMKCLRPLNYLPISARNTAASMVRITSGKSIRGAKMAAMIESGGSLSEMYPVTRLVLSTSNRRSLLSKKWKRFDEEWRDPYADLLRTAYQQAEGAELFARISYAEGRTYMHDVLLRDTDQMSMAHALEVRVPLLDHKLVEYVMGAPDSYKRPNGVPKSLLVSSLGDLLPHDIVHRPKRGFTLPFAEWMRGALRDFCEARLHPRRIASRGIFDADEVNRLWQAFLNGSPEVSWSRLWVLVALEDWLGRNHVECLV
jgi:asparagine synthase (glutamine-hydrolysing)